MELSEVLKHRNVDGNPYLSDIDEWLGVKLSPKIRRQLVIKIRELQDSQGEINGKSKKTKRRENGRDKSCST